MKTIQNEKEFNKELTLFKIKNKERITLIDSFYCERITYHYLVIDGFFIELAYYPENIDDFEHPPILLKIENCETRDYSEFLDNFDEVDEEIKKQEIDKSIDLDYIISHTTECKYDSLEEATRDLYN